MKKNLGTVTDWSLIGKEEYMTAMRKSPVDPMPILKLIRNAQTDDIDDRDTFIRGIERSYFYEAEE